MSFNQRQFEKELKNKLSSRVTGTMTEETLFLKSFKYFDLDNSGSCSKTEFMKALIKIGVNSVDEENIDEVFFIYDKDKNGEIDYKEFVSVLFKKDQLQPKKETKCLPDKPKQSSGQTKQAFITENEAIILKIREALVKRGVGAIVSIARNFKIIDDNHNHQLDYNEFEKAAKDFKFGLTEAEVKKAFLCFNVKNTGAIDYDEFLRAVRGNMNNFRVNLVKQAFDILDVNRNGMIEMEEISSKYNARLHPDVQSGRKSEEDVFQDFINTFQDQHCILNGTEADEVITLDEFIEYYQNVSMTIDDDVYFEVMMNNVWRININTTINNDKKGWSNVDSQAKGKDNLSSQYQQRFPNKNQPNFESTGHPLLDKFKLKLINRGTRGIISLARLFKIIDDNHSKGLELDEFLKVMRDFHMDLTAKEIEELFSLIDRNSSGIIDYEEFLRAIRGEMNQRRRAVVEKAYKNLDLDSSGEINMSEVLSIYNAKKHPLVVSGEKTEEEIIGQFLETFETHHIVIKGTRNRRVTEAEFIEYYNNISMSIDNDDLFEEIIIRAWKLDGAKEHTRKAWTGEIGNQKARRQMPNRTPYGVDKDKTNYGTSSNPISANTFAEKKDELIEKFRECLRMRGVRGIMSIRRSFMLIDENNSKTIDFKEFTKLIHEYQLKVNDAELKVIFNTFDKDKSGEIDYEEFVSGIEGEMNIARKAIVTKAFKKLDRENVGNVSIDIIRQEFNHKKHPEVREGKKDEQEALAEFLDMIEYHFNLLNEDKYLDGMVSLNEFIDFYRNISLGITDDKYFDVLMISSWNLDNICPYQRGWKGENI